MPVAKRIARAGLLAVIVWITLVGLAEGIAATLPSSEIAYVSVRERNGDIYLLDLDNLISVNLTNSDANDLNPEWSPDGLHIAFSSNRRGNNQEIYVLNLMDGAIWQLTGNIGYDVYNPDWSPDGQKIALQIIPQEGGMGQLCFVEVDRTNSDCIADSWAVAWSPDGDTFAYYTYTPHSGTVVHRSDSDGSNDRVLTDDLGISTGMKPAWSPDGRRIAYSRAGDIYVMNADGGDQSILIDYGGDEHNFTWSNDGRLLVFQSNRDGNEELYMLEIDSARVHRLTNNMAIDHSPVWRP